MTAQTRWFSTNISPFHSPSRGPSGGLQKLGRGGATVMEATHRSIEIGALFSNMRTASSLHNQGNGFSFRHLTLLSKENPSCLVPPWTEAAPSSVLDPKQKADGERCRHIPQNPHKAQMPWACWDSCEGVQHRATPQKTPPLPHTQSESQPGKTPREGQTGGGQGLPVRLSAQHPWRPSIWLQ